MKTLDEIKQMMAAGDTAKAAEELKELLAKEPQNLQAKMLYGTCCQLLGDEATFKSIHDEVAIRIYTKKHKIQEEELSIWNQFHGLWIWVSIGALVLGGVAAYSISSGTGHCDAMTGYRGPSYDRTSLLVKKSNTDKAGSQCSQKWNNEALDSGGSRSHR